MKIIAVILLLVLLPLFLGLLFEVPKPHMIYAQYILQFMGLLSLLFSIYLTIDVFTTHCKYDNNEIEFYSLWNGNRKLFWKDLQQIQFSENMKWYILTFNEKKKIRLSLYLIGSAFILKHLETLNIKLKLN